MYIKFNHISKLYIIQSFGLPFKVRHLFLGDYVDRGRHPLEVIVRLLACKIQFPKFVFLLRGNHELFHINKTYGFAVEIRTRYRIQADAQGKILCMHGDLSPELNSLNDIRNVKRPLRMVKCLAQDLLLADPENGAKEKINVVEFGCAFFANRRLITVFSAARYHEGLCNFATVVVPSEYEQQRKEKLVPTADVEDDLEDKIHIYLSK
ncbi:unnamed protein product [Wuchereria bancrofti]|uniref:Serine/threonine-protein phosphatase n=1 Tax=Wuchereria bancrofti TaxID=6293 RepID=A0A3P7DK08_WUCBA|nr:unnamed protein product [Wuchereria bancrofti]